MFVVRPRGIRGTPATLAMDLGCETRFYPNPRRPNRTFDYDRDFFMAPVHPEHTVGAPDAYRDTVSFALRNKYGQRKELQRAGIPVPGVASTTVAAEALSGTEFVVRPLRHSRGLGYRVTGDRRDFRAGQEYISEFYRKKREYRIIFVFGQPLIFLRKKPNEGVDATQPWGHENSRFQTIHDYPTSKLAATDVVERLRSFTVVAGAHVVAADVLWRGGTEKPYAVLELNFCPALDIDNNRAKVVDCIQRRQRGQAVIPAVPPPVAPPPNPRTAVLRELIRQAQADRDSTVAQLREEEQALAILVTELRELEG